MKIHCYPGPTNATVAIDVSDEAWNFVQFLYKSGYEMPHRLGVNEDIVCFPGPGGRCTAWVNVRTEECVDVWNFGEWSRFYSLSDAQNHIDAMLITECKLKRIHD